MQSLSLRPSRLAATRLAIGHSSNVILGILPVCDCYSADIAFVRVFYSGVNGLFLFTMDLPELNEGNRLQKNC
jgi:hypothetical protein